MPPEPTSFECRLAAVESRLQRALDRSGRRRSEITLVAVSKKFSAECLMQAYHAGIRHFGENYVQEFAMKKPLLSDMPDAHFHLIGHLQSNKVRSAVDLFDTIQTVDSPKLLTRLETAASEAGKHLSVYFEINMGNEETKHGAEPVNIPELVQISGDCPHLRVAGLMAIPPWSDDPEVSRPYFRQLASLAREYRLPGLSMGMSADFEAAIEEGATVVRVGTALFGAAAETSGSMKFLRLISCLGFTLVILSGQVIRQNSTGPIEQERLGVSIPMRDGVKLAADIFLPRLSGRVPSVLVRTPYGRKAASTASYRYFATRGYAVILQDVRGRNASEGRFGQAPQEGPDGNDTLDWIARQPWSDGHVAMAGSSYLGIVQWWAAVQANPHLAAISPMCSGDDEYTDRWYSTGGALQIGHRLLWLAENLTPPSHVRPLFDSYAGHLPLRTADVVAAGTALPMWRTALSHPSYDNFWKSLSIREKLDRMTVPVLSLGGWFDEYAESDLDAFSRLSKRSEAVETWIGPWSHSPGWKFPTRDFGRDAYLPIREKQGNWFDRWLKQKPEHAEPAAPLLHLFVMGPNVWREEHEWPLARTRFTPAYLTSAGHANTATGDGVLQWMPARTGKQDTFSYDPKDPVPTTGGSLCCDPIVLPAGPLDQSKVENRADVLVYTSAPLSEDMEVTGPVRTILYVASSANDTDFTAKLVDMEPDGRPLLVTDGIQRMRYRVSLQTPSLIKRNTPYQVTIDAGVTSYVFSAGHRVRLEVSSSNFPRFDRSLNTARPNAEETKTQKAKQTVFHELGYPSALILPVIPKPSRRPFLPRREGSRNRTAG